MHNLSLLNVMFIITAAGKPQAIISKKQARDMDADQVEGKESMRLITNANNSGKMMRSMMNNTSFAT